jgi:hypothetical protein
MREVRTAQPRSVTAKPIWALAKTPPCRTGRLWQKDGALPQNPQWDVGDFDRGIILCVFWYGRFKLSFQDLLELMVSPMPRRDQRLNRL